MLLAHFSRAVALIVHANITESLATCPETGGGKDAAPPPAITVSPRRFWNSLCSDSAPQIRKVYTWYDIRLKESEFHEF